MKYGTYKDKEYDTRHGGPFDRGAADSYYNRPIHPHYYVGDTSFSDMVESMHMSAEETEAYLAGYAWNDEFGDTKSWD